jgi:hypothetical protein
MAFQAARLCSSDGPGSSSMRDRLARPKDLAAIQAALTAQQACLAIAADTIVRALRAHADLS